jgi:hypothetical protein
MAFLAENGLTPTEPQASWLCPGTPVLTSASGLSCGEPPIPLSGFLLCAGRHAKFRRASFRPCTRATRLRLLQVCGTLTERVGVKERG